MPKTKPREDKVDSGDPARLANKTEQKKVDERVAIGPHIVYEAIRLEGEVELRRPAPALAWSGFAAGLSMGFSLITEGLLAAHMPDLAWAALVSKFGYSIGFLIVILGRQQLFTENTLTVILPLLLRKDLRTALNVLRLWSIVLGSNVVGTYLFALCVAKVAIFDPHVHETLLRVSQERLGSGFGVVLIRAIFAGWLIALMVWLLPSAESARVSIIIIITYVIGLGGFSHIIAGSTKMLFLVASGAMSWAAYFTQFFVPTLFGNIVGGVSLVAFLGHAQVVAGKEL